MISNKWSGVIYVVLAYTIWGLGPLYYSFLHDIPTVEMVCFRVLFGTLSLVMLVYAMKNVKYFLKIYKNKKLWLSLSITSILIVFNWSLYLWAINNNHVMDASLGYFMIPLIIIFCGIFFFKEKLTKFKAISVFLTVCGVSYNIYVFHGIPWIALSLAFSFAIYTVLRKKIPIDSQSGLLFEMVLFLPLALSYLIFLDVAPTANFFQNSILLDLLIMGAGLLTVLPLIFLHKATLRLDLTTIGFFQYINPTLALLTAIYMYNEPFTSSQMISFSFIWIALMISITESFILSNKNKNKNKALI
ncbi:protein RarD [Paraphotobacterium marinum]|uniref:Protein RarD n=1 Tax=Paraphotobacterium marinum TaxID=1755811 RepID=A0A220VFG1_9GAMM|nr:EamA family transporter RarD [Paraphotobacterium marinum]ASK79079.1 protein RarD [Paraphotobacterium marinum]